ncbi:hypothetical protein SETIT_7G140800v2 [Setaria italica]|uniref:Uncharacterized protein n=1 Tax=Setaria italica TaxID=4555 RepID=A0A368RVM2_SETIT|nr:hypothetical protein SETIT_7G140800v2 [Setaria italica]
MTGGDGGGEAQHRAPSSRWARWPPAKRSGSGTSSRQVQLQQQVQILRGVPHNLQIFSGSSNSNSRGGSSGQSSSRNLQMCCR